MNINKVRVLGIGVISAIIFVGLVFFIWNLKLDRTRPIYTDEIEDGTQVDVLSAVQKPTDPKNQNTLPSQTLTAPIPAATSSLDANLTQTVVGLSTVTSSPTLLATPCETPTQTPTSTPSPSLTWTPTPTDTSTPVPTSTPSLSPTWTSTSTDTSTPVPTSTPSPSLTWTPTPTDTGTPIPPPTATLPPTNTSTPVPAHLSGRLLLNGVPLEENATLILEDQSFNPIAETIVSPGGTYIFTDVPINLDGYNILFSQDQNTAFGVYEVVSWGWFGPIIVQNGVEIGLPDFDIGLQELEYTNPIPDSQIPLSTITDNSPLSFQWTGHPYAEKYWVTLLDGDNLVEIWRSGLITNSSVDFYGTLSDGSRIQIGQYWWGVGVQGPLGDFTITAFGFLDGFTITP